MCTCISRLSSHPICSLYASRYPSAVDMSAVTFNRPLNHPPPPPLSSPGCAILSWSIAAVGGGPGMMYRQPEIRRTQALQSSFSIYTTQTLGRAEASYPLYVFSVGIRFEPITSVTAKKTKKHLCLLTFPKISFRAERGCRAILISTRQAAFLRNRIKCSHQGHTKVRQFGDKITAN